MKESSKDIIEIHARLLDKAQGNNEIADLQESRSSLLTEFRGSMFKLFHMTGVNPPNGQGIGEYPYVFKAEKKSDSRGTTFIKVLSILSQPMINPIKRKVEKRVRKGA